MEELKEIKKEGKFRILVPTFRYQEVNCYLNILFIEDFALDEVGKQNRKYYCPIDFWEVLVSANPFIDKIEVWKIE